MKQIISIIAISLLASYQMNAREYHVSLNGSDTNEGSAVSPLRTINAAAQLALPGDTVTVHAGIYREWVNPLNGGESNEKRILYRAVSGDKVELKGSELIRGWKKEKGGKGVWKITLPDKFFGNYNPYRAPIWGDWFRGNDRIHHTGDVYLNDVSMYEVPDKEKVLVPDTIRSMRDPQGTQRVWCTVADSGNITIYANFGSSDPNKEMVEIAARPTCFYPTRQGLNYITIRGFHISQAATQWAAPTAEQVGMVATNWCKGWIIEDNIIKNSRCNGISLGKERSTGHNLETTDKRLDGTAHYLEVIFNTLRHGWQRDYVGSHIVRNNIISDCEQTAICGSMGGAFCEIYGNHIYNIWSKRQFGGLEMAGIKLHGAIDTYIHNNRLHGCGYGIWLDWMAQGARVSSNLFYDNTTDLFIEVSHGPYMVDNNLFLSPQSLRECTDGGAFVHNLFAGNINRYDDRRYTPYQLAHSTQIKGISTITNGDHRFYNNIFVGGEDKKAVYGLAVYNPAKRPVYATGNLFYNGAKPMGKKGQSVTDENFTPQLTLEEKEDGVYLSFAVDREHLSDLKLHLVTFEMLGQAQLTGYSYTMPDGTPIKIDKDYWGNQRLDDSLIVGPFEIKPKEKQEVKVWDTSH
ncbi:right-handed parallel beta-helix repeat-containing protein [Bacteroides sp.]|uniref:right-handed parallel beta-helix repeat-containing protein n=1 Tax=Bacteroides sp. TaxID=29523 RepID=UPI0025B7BE5E|nr:right-handed parallel beta-helix repeat-containing protein [Bacteroides sp.]